MLSPAALSKKLNLWNSDQNSFCCFCWFCFVLTFIVIEDSSLFLLSKCNRVTQFVRLLKLYVQHDKDNVPSLVCEIKTNSFFVFENDKEKEFSERKNKTIWQRDANKLGALYYREIVLICKTAVALENTRLWKSVYLFMCVRGKERERERLIHLVLAVVLAVDESCRLQPAIWPGSSSTERKTLCCLYFSFISCGQRFCFVFFSLLLCEIQVSQVSVLRFAFNLH